MSPASLAYNIFIRIDDNTNAILLNMKKLIMLLTPLILFSSCISNNESADQEHPSIDSLPSNSRVINAFKELTPTQQAAFDALDTLQISSDEMSRMYSTFAGIKQQCYPPDTSLTISQAELLLAMKQFVTSNYKNLSAEKREELAAKSVLAQEAYTVLLCINPSVPVTYENGAPMTGTWVMPNVLGRRDVVIEW